ncbi:MAG TPA: HAMP domain-containing sensor histidine kinase [Kofleriaceae bacterium]|nr:HAMP domain-containing sensor histidine kinase [Kofleriaceae bacterium]
MLLVVATAGLTTTGVIALHEVNAQHLRMSRDLALDLLAADDLQTHGEELAAARVVLLTRGALDPWLALWAQQVRSVLADLRERRRDEISRSQLRDIELALAECERACLDTVDEYRSRAAHDRLGIALRKFIDREVLTFEHALSRVDDAAFRFEVTLVVFTLMILLAGISLAAVATRKIDHLFSAEQAAAKRAQKEAAARQEVLAIVSHDLRTPLSAVVLGSALLAEILPDNGQPRGPRRQLQVIRNAADRMTDLIDEILDTARIEAGTLTVHVTTCDVGEALDKTIEMFQLRAAGRSIALKREPSPPGVQVRADPTRLMQVLSNLTSNAVKFTPPGGEIKLCAEAKHDHVLFTVEDSGPGIPEDEREHLFDPYWQAAGSDRQRGSLGLGLFICKSLVEAHGGTIWVEPRQGGGSRFRFTIPRAVHQPAA